MSLDKIKCICLSAILFFCTTVMPVCADSTNVSVEYNPLNQRISITSGLLSGEEGVIDIYYPGMVGVTVTNDNIKNIIAFSSAIVGGETIRIVLPPTAPMGRYIVRETSKAAVTETSFTYFTGGENSLLFDNFDNAILWNTEGMGIIDGRLCSKSGMVSSAKLKSSEKNGFYNEIVSFDFEFVEKAGSDSWLMAAVRDNNISADRFIIRDGRISKYDRNNGEQNIVSYPKLSYNQTYHLKIIPNNMNVRLVLSNVDGSIIADKIISTDNIHSGGISFQTSALRVAIDNLNIERIPADNFGITSKIIALSTGETVSISAYNAQGVSYESGETSVATISGSNVTGIAPGIAEIKGVCNGTEEYCTVIVYDPIQTLELPEKDICLTKGENISLSAIITPGTAEKSSLVWKSSNDNAVAIFGSAYDTRTICAVDCGTAVVSVTAPGGISTEAKIRVLPQKSKAESFASFGISGDAKKISQYAFGVHHSLTDKTEEAYSLFEDMGFSIVRTFGKGAEKEYSSSDFEFANKRNIPQMLSIPFVKQTDTDIINQVKQINKSISRNEKLYIEFGNECYDGQINISEYIIKAKKISEMLREEFDNILIGVPFYAVMNSAWNDALLADTSYYDAIVLHTYTEIGDVDKKTQSDMMNYLYAGAEYNEQVISKYASSAPDKQIWLSEYGTFISDLFNQSDDSEKGRMQFGKTTGVAVTNMEKILNVLGRNNAYMSAFHFSNDGQGFGIIQGKNKLSNYYAFKEAAELFNNNSHYYKVEPLGRQRNTVSKSVYYGAICDVSSVGAWGFGDSDRIKYVVFSNRTDSLYDIMLDGMSLKRVWSYGSETPLEGYLNNSARYVDVPNDITIPKSYNEDFKSSVKADAYSIVVCEVSDNSENHAFSVNAQSKDWDFNSTGGLKLFCNVLPEEINLSANGVILACNLTDNDGYIEIEPEMGFRYDTEYVLNVVCGGQREEYRLNTKHKPNFEYFLPEFTDDFSQNLSEDKYITENQAWIIQNEKLYKKSLYEDPIKIKQKYGDFVMTFDVDYADSTKHITVGFGGGYIRLLNNGYITSYYNGKNDALCGYMDGQSVKIVKKGTNAYIYSKMRNEHYYKYAGTVKNISEQYGDIYFAGSGNCYLDNLAVYTNKSEISNIICKNDNITVPFPLKGDNAVSVNIKSNISSDDMTVLGLYDESNRLIAVQYPDSVNGDIIGFNVEVADAEYTEYRLFLWDKNLTPRSQSYIID